MASSRVGASTSARGVPGGLAGDFGMFPLARQDRHEKCGGFAGTGLRLAGDVVVREAVRQHFALDRRAVLEAEIGDAMHDRQRQREVVKAIAILDLWYRELIECPG